MMVDDNSQGDVSALEGRVLKARYRLDKFLNRGGFGAVYKATELRFNTTVAVKTGLNLREFTREAKLLKSVEHPNIVHVDDYDVDSGLAFIVMEYLHGEDLDKLFEGQNRRLSQDQLQKLVAEIGSALSYAHSRTLIHRDLKPQNIILKEPQGDLTQTSEGTKFVLLDFGIASQLNTTGTMANFTLNGAGTIEYMAPELLVTSPRATPQSDIYAFGIILYQMITGSVPFPQRDQSIVGMSECVKAIQLQEPAAFVYNKETPAFHRRVEALVLSCLAKDPTKRPQSIGEVCERFSKAIAPPKPPEPATPRKPKERPLPDNLQELVKSKIDGRYTLIKLIGCSSNGALFRAKDEKLDGEVAVKIGTANGSFEKEVKNAAAIRHENIASISDSGTYCGAPFFVREYLSGMSLDAVFQRQKQELYKFQLRKLVQAVGDALEYAHGVGKFHSNLKPSNIILKDPTNKPGGTTDNGRFMLVDFGIAAKFDPAAPRNKKLPNTAATVQYMAPELLGSNPLSSSKTDIYSFGVVLFQMLTGTTPFPLEDDSPEAVKQCVHAIQRQRPPSFKQAGASDNPPSGIEELVLSCLSKDPKRRPASISDLRDRFIAIHDQAYTPLPSQVASGTIRLSDFQLNQIRDEPTTDPVVKLVQPKRKTSFFALIAVSFISISVALGLVWWVPRPMPNEHAPVVDLVIDNPDGSNANDGSQPIDLITGDAKPLQVSFSLSGYDRAHDPSIEILFPDANVTHESRGDQNTIHHVVYPSGLAIQVVEDFKSNLAVAKTVTYKVTADLNSPPQQNVAIAIVATLSGKEPIKKAITLNIRRPEPWIPEPLKNLGFKASPDSWLYRLSPGQIISTILERVVSEDHNAVRFRLIPGKQNPFNAETRVPTYYLMEEVVSKQLFKTFAKQTSTNDFLKPQTSSADSSAEADNQPATNIRLVDAQRFAWWLATREFGTLPSKNEWELAAGYWDFRLHFKKGIADQQKIHIQMTDLSSEACITAIPEKGWFHFSKGMQEDHKSPYGCRFSYCNELKLAEFTSSFNDPNSNFDLQNILKGARTRKEVEEEIRKQAQDFLIPCVIGRDFKKDELLSWLPDPAGDPVEEYELFVENGIVLYGETAKAITRDTHTGFRVAIRLGAH